MAKNQLNQALAEKREKVLAQRGNKKFLLLLIGIAVVAGVGGAYLAGGSKKGEADPSEKKYISRYLPVNYREPQLTEKEEYTAAKTMTTVSAELSREALSLGAGEVIKNKIVYFEYKKPGVAPIPMIAYVKPSGKLFVGVSECPPCQSRFQRIDSDGTLTCQSCGTKRDPETQVGISGACRLYPLDEMPAKLTGSKVVIDRAELDRFTPQTIDRPVGG